MIFLEDKVLSDDIRDVKFCCDLPMCKGACCVEGDAGAPLEEEEISLLEDYLDLIAPFMVPEGIQTVKETGVFDYDAEGKFVTPLIKGKECAYVYFEKEIARCAIEKAYQDKIIPFPKPVSCHLYPIRIRHLRNQDTLNYHKWPICKKALEKGSRENLAIYQFLEDALVRKYGRSWFTKLEKIMH